MRARLALAAALALVAVALAVVGGRPDPTRPVPTQAGRETAAPTPVSPDAPPERWAGVTWTRLEGAPFDDPDVRFGGVGTDGSRVVAWGDKDSEDGVGPPGRRAISIVWTWDGALAWRRHEPRLPGGEPFRLAQVRVSAEGFAALGSSGGPIKMASSVDGGQWTLVDAPVQPPGLVFPSAGGLVTVGVVAGAPVVFVSDGSDWRAIHGPAQLGQYRIGDVARTADGLAIVGSFGAQGNWDGLLWRWGMSGGLVDVAGQASAFTGPDRSVTLHRAVPHVLIHGDVEVLSAGLDSSHEAFEIA